MEKNKQLSQQQLLLIDHNKQIDAIQCSIKKLTAKKQNFINKINSLSVSKSDTGAYNKNKTLYTNLQDIDLKNKEIEEKIKNARNDLEYKIQQFETTKQKIDEDFITHVS